MEGWQDLLKVSREEALVGLRTGGNLLQEMAYGNHRSVQKYKDEVLRTAMADVATNRAMVFEVESTMRIRRLHITPVEIVKEKGGNSVIHDFSFEGPWSSAVGEPWRSRNADTDWERVPGCELGGVLV